MTEPGSTERLTIGQDAVLAAIHCHEDMREFFLAMFEQNPHLRRTAGARVNDILTPLAKIQERADLAHWAAIAR